MQYKIDEKLLKELVNYLVQKPFVEVVNLINGINQLERLPKAEKEEPKKDK